MRESQWSPAPWVRWKTQRDPPTDMADGDCILSAELESGARHVVAIIARHYGESKEQLEANAHLIVSAPELYEALNLARKLLQEHHSAFIMRPEHHVCPVCTPNPFFQIDSALAKARGESQ